jgi:beta-mannanase
VSWADIAAGKQDAAIITAAKQLKALGTPVMLAFQHEPENDTNGTTDTAASYVGAWRRVVTVFRSEGVSNVSFVWIMMASTFSSTGAANAFYPGDSYIDWVAADGYNWAYNQPGQPWRSFQDTFTNFYAWGSAHPKPLMVGETGTMDDPSDPTRKGQWLSNIPAALKTWPKIKAVVYFDASGWRYDYTTLDLTGFQTLAASSYLH